MNVEVTCPRDHTKLIPIDYPPARRCPSCQGLWIEASNFSELARDTAPPPSPRSTPADTYQGPRHDPIPCPLPPHARMTQPVVHGIQVDLCRAHQAFWLDGGEYEQLIRIHRLRHHTEVTDQQPSLVKEVVADVAIEGTSAASDFAGELLESTVEFVGDVFGSVFSLH